ncbi:hypothetical protein [Acetobacter oeni]|uniref:Uncharacterized protein n=1 Tax=Acetobacter oeni TaxID=304077 RepID=A0A511XKY6_9PROT|nr:hypothetical protein [Acetobacter oeni]MBB3883252.1 hypothetical protein [Acetobacter oeni]GBR07183.1 hypothetical protein AA21952_2266 [Acetobacter oeni LMG 21952]GEN63599.1 hypothetical protein AOE01nite_18230 [Acetobacter oeni]
MTDKMKILPKKKETEFEKADRASQEQLDEVGEETFPASDPPSSGKSTGPGDTGSPKGE